MRIKTRRIPQVTMRVVETEDPTWWLCRCGNTPREEGFLPCDAAGTVVEPTPAAWTTNWYVCLRCGRMIDYRTRVIVGRVKH